MKERVEQALQSLIGELLWGAGRAVDMGIFKFGPRHTVINRRGDAVEIGTYALHVQCVWRIVGPEGITVASGDQYQPSEASGLEQDDPGFTWDQAGANRADERCMRFFEERSAAPLRVERVQADEVGSVGLLLSDGYRLDVFPADSQSTEHWRFFQPNIKRNHFVVTGAGIED